MNQVYAIVQNHPLDKEKIISYFKSKLQAILKVEKLLKESREQNLNYSYEIRSFNLEDGIP